MPDKHLLYLFGEFLIEGLLTQGSYDKQNLIHRKL